MISRPYRNHRGEFIALSLGNHLSCWDCEHLRVGAMPYRECIKHRNQHIYGCGPVKYEVQDEEEMNRIGSVADRCKDFRVASEFRFLLVMDEI